jgi:Na+-transporting methylmalonyl-CoA/oxaloacetate decarboxylase gamma subunit
LTALSVPLAMPLNDDTVTPGFLGFGVFLALAVALVFLIRSMNKQIRRIQAPHEADLKQQEWERAQAARDQSGVKASDKNAPPQAS